jgi:hypothetical protein
MRHVLVNVLYLFAGLFVFYIASGKNAIKERILVVHHNEVKEQERKETNA